MHTVLLRCFGLNALFDDLTPRRCGFDSQSRVRIPRWNPSQYVASKQRMEWDSLQVGGVGETPMGQQRAVDRKNGHQNFNRLRPSTPAIRDPRPS